MLNISRIKEMVGITAIEQIEIQENQFFLNNKKELFVDEMENWASEYDFSKLDDEQKIVTKGFFESIVSGDYQESFYINQYHQAMEWRKRGLNQSKVLLLISQVRKLFILFSEEVESTDLAKGLCHVLDMSQSIVSTVYQVAEEINRMEIHMKHELKRVERSFGLLGIKPPPELVQPYVDHQNWKFLAYKLAIGEHVHTETLELSPEHCQLALWLKAGGWDVIPDKQRKLFDDAHRRVHKLGALAIQCSKLEQPEKVLDFLLEMEAASTTVSDVLLNVIEDEFIRLATSDGLTGLPNRRSFDMDFEKHLAFAERRSLWVGLVLIDIDHFKPINDVYGHIVGDQVIKQVARTVAQCARTEEQAYRWGGEEFAVVTIDESPQSAEILAERIRSTVEKEIFHDELLVGLNLTVSCGSICFQAPYDQPLHEIFSMADKNLYKAKEAGRNTVYHQIIEKQQ